MGQGAFRNLLRAQGGQDRLCPAHPLTSESSYTIQTCVRCSWDFKGQFSTDRKIVDL